MLEKKCFWVLRAVKHYQTALNFWQPPVQKPPPWIFAAQPYLVSRRLKLNGSGVEVWLNKYLYDIFCQIIKKLPLSEKCHIWDYPFIRYYCKVNWTNLWPPSINAWFKLVHSVQMLVLNIADSNCKELDFKEPK